MVFYNTRMIKHWR